MTDGSHLYQTLLSIFECPVCLEYIVPPLTGCENGHYLCDSCRPRVRCCPLCRGPIGESRNYRLEALAQELKYPCRNTERGCSQRLVAGKVNRHERSCNYRLYHCPLRHVTRCGWTGVKGKVCSHMSSSHECECGEGGVRRQMRGGRLGSVGGMSLVEYQEEMFLCTSFLSISLSRFIVIVQFIGAREVAGRFLYTVRFSTKDGKDILLRTATVTSLDLEETCLTGDFVGMDLQEFRGLVRPGNEGLGLVLKVDVLRCYNPLGRSLAQSYDVAGGPQGSYGGPQGSSGGPQGSYGGPQSSSSGLRGSSCGSQGSYGGPQGSSGGLLGTSGGPQGSYGGSHLSSGGLQGSSGGLQGSSDGLRGSSGGCQGSYSGSQSSYGGLRGSYGGPQSSFGGLRRFSGVPQESSRL